VENKLIVKKPFFTINSFLKSYYRDIEVAIENQSPFLLHFRMATGSKTNKKNTHPFLLNENICFAHNGILNIPSTIEKSDTKQFCLELRILDSMSVFSKPMQRLLNSYFEINRSKAVFLRNDGEYFICNEQSGIWKYGDWYSNSYSFPIIESKWNLLGFHNNTKTVNKKKKRKTRSHITPISYCPYCESGLYESDFSGILEEVLYCPVCYGLLDLHDIEDALYLANIEVRTE
jgi:hypothetical protein